MTDPIIINMSLADAFKSAGLDSKNQEDLLLFQEAAQAIRGAGNTVSDVAKIAYETKMKRLAEVHYD